MKAALLAVPIALALAAPAPYRAEPGGPPPEELAPPIREAVAQQGVRVVDSRGFRFCELWIREAPLGDASFEEAVRQQSVPEGTLLGAIEFRAPSADRRGRGFPPGLYVLRHAGGDSAALLPAAGERSIEPDPDFASRSRSILRWWLGPAGPTPRLELNQRGEWILHVRVGDTPVTLLVTGVAAR
ncbi:MAG: hypothetical protein ACP5U2_13475 [Bryobacteraceae bacterium]